MKRVGSQQTRLDCRAPYLTAFEDPGEGAIAVGTPVVDFEDAPAFTLKPFRSAPAHRHSRVIESHWLPGAYVHRSEWYEWE